MRLYLVRHGEAVSDAVDPKRPLSARGQDEIETTAVFLQSRKFSARIFFHSAKLRARQTAEILRNTLYPGGQLFEKGYLSPDDDPGPILKDIAEAKEDFLIAGHMPFLARLVSSLVDGEKESSLVTIPTGGLVILDGRDHRWMIQAVFSPEAT
jgi:phosphohistidine phosphatase